MCSKFSQNRRDIFREMGVWNFLADAPFSSLTPYSALWREISRGIFRAHWTLLNTVAILTKTTSGFEIWWIEFSFLGLLWGNIYRVTSSSISRFFFHIYHADPSLTSVSLNEMALPQFEQIEFKLPENFISVIRENKWSAITSHEHSLNGCR